MYIKIKVRHDMSTVDAGADDVTAWTRARPRHLVIPSKV